MGGDRQSGRVPAGLLPVERAQLARQERERRKIRHEVMDGEEEHGAQEADPQQRPMLQWEGAVGLLGQPRLAPIVLQEIDLDPVQNLPHGLVARHAEDRAQCGVTVRQPFQGAAQRPGIETAADARRDGDVVGAAFRGQPFQEPQRALALREPSRVLAGGGRRGLPLQRDQKQLGQAAGRGPLQQLGQGQLHAEGRLDAPLEIHGGQRVEPEGDQRPLRIDRFGGRSQNRRRSLPKGALQKRPALARRRGEERVAAGQSHRRRSSLFGSQRATAEDRELTGQVTIAAEAALHLAAGGLRHRPGAHQHDLVHLDLVLFGHGAADRVGQLAEIRLPVPLHLLDDDEPLLAGDLDREGGAAARPQLRMAALGRQLDVLRIVVAAAEDDQVLEPAGDEQLAAAQKAEIPGAQERTLAAIRQPGREIAPRAFGVAPVAEGHARPRHPDLPHLARRQLDRRLGVDDRDPLPSPRPAAAHQPARSPGPCRGRRGRRGRHLVPFQGGDLDGLDPRQAARDSAADEQRRLGEAVAGIERLAAEAAGGEGLGEALQRLRPHRLGAVEGHPPARQVELPRAARRDLRRTHSS